MDLKFLQPRKAPDACFVKFIYTIKQSHKADRSALEAEIDRLVYELYGLTEEEIKIVEGAN